MEKFKMFGREAHSDLQQLVSVIMTQPCVSLECVPLLWDDFSHGHTFRHLAHILLQ